MAENLKLSIVVPVYNGGDLLRKSLQGYADQLTKDMELVLIDDGSTDGSGEICLRCREDAGKCGRQVRYVRQENGGIAEARNRGLREAQGKYICFFDQDDQADLQVYAGLIERLETLTATTDDSAVQAKDCAGQTSARMGMCSTSFGTEAGWLPYEKLQDTLFVGGETRKLVYQLFLNGFTTKQKEQGLFFYGTIWKCVFDREWLLGQDLFFHVFKNYEDDWLFLLETFLKIEVVLCVKETGYYWRENALSESHDKKYREDLLEREERLTQYVGEILQQTDAETEETADRLYDICMGPFLCGELPGLLDNVHNAPRGRERMLEKGKVKAWVLWHKAEGTFKCADNIRKNVIRKRYACKAVLRFSFETAYLIDRMVCLLIGVAQKAKFIRKIERRRKHSGQ